MKRSPTDPKKRTREQGSGKKSIACSSQMLHVNGLAVVQEGNALPVSAPVRFLTLTQAQVDALAGEEGTVVFNSTTSKLTLFSKGDGEQTASAKDLVEEAPGGGGGGGGGGGTTLTRSVGDVFMSSRRTVESSSGGNILVCDGRTLSQAAYPDLFDVVGFRPDIDTWTARSPQNLALDFWHIFFSTAQDRWVVSTTNGTIFSTDADADWTNHGQPGAVANTNPVIAQFGNRVFLGGRGGIITYLDPDNSTGRFNLVPPGMDYRTASGGQNALVFPSNQIAVDAGFTTITYSTDGATFSSASGDTESKWLSSCFDSTRNRFLVFGEDRAASRSTDGTGSAWTTLGTFPAGAGDNVTAATYSSSLDRILVLVKKADDSVQTMTSDDGGDTWENEWLFPAVSTNKPFFLTWDPTHSLFLGVSDRSLFFTPDGLVWFSQSIGVTGNQSCAAGTGQDGFRVYVSREASPIGAYSNPLFSFNTGTQFLLPYRLNYELNFLIPYIQAK